MKTINIIQANAIKAFNGADEKGKKLLTDLLGSEHLSQKITDRVKSFEDACEELDINPTEQLPYEDPGSKDHAAINAYAKLFIIAKALNEGWVPDWNNSSQTKYYPWFDMRAASGFSHFEYDYSRMFTLVGSRLCFKSKELAGFAGHQFLSIYKDAFTI